MMYYSNTLHDFNCEQLIQLIEKIINCSETLYVRENNDLYKRVHPNLPCGDGLTSILEFKVRGIRHL